MRMCMMSVSRGLGKGVQQRQGFFSPCGHLLVLLPEPLARLLSGCPTPAHLLLELAQAALKRLLLL